MLNYFKENGNCEVYKSLNFGPKHVFIGHAMKLYRGALYPGQSVDMNVWSGNSIEITEASEEKEEPNDTKRIPELF